VGLAGGIFRHAQILTFAEVFKELFT
jgi:hypothetical protein